ncbi:flavin reductase [Rhodobacteraceae bacterium RKSG542]|nr:flavin reductase [Pseudovibrio flavus]
MSRLGSSVHILASDGASGRTGATVSSVCSVSDNPPTLLVCLNRGTAVNGQVKENGVFTINTLAHDHTDASNAFAGVGQLPMNERFALADWETIETGAPALKDARVSFDCKVTQITEVGTHSVIFGEVVAVKSSEQNKALIYMDRNYHAL